MSNAEKRDQRFRQLLDLADEGNEEAVSDLWLEYGYEYTGSAA